MSSKPLTKLGKEIWQTCDEKGFHEPVPTGILENALRLLLLVGEVGEALECLRKGEYEHHREEIADVAIRLFHYATCNDIDLDAEVASKMAINKHRPFKHGKKF